jgi:hypothetical protein
MKRADEGAEAAFRFARGRQLEQFLLSPLDLLRGKVVEIFAERAGDDVLPDRSEPATLVVIVDRAPVMLGVDDRHRRLNQAHEVLRSTHVGESAVLIE